MAKDNVLSKYAILNESMGPVDNICCNLSIFSTEKHISNSNSDRVLQAVKGCEAGGVAIRIVTE